MSQDQRICVIGAGAAGISAVYYLRGKGYHNVEILEASDRAGGKCRSFHHNGVTYAIGRSALSNGDIENNIAEDFAAIGARLVRVLQHNRWRYSPHLRANRMLTFYPAVEERQGVGSIYHGGDIMSFGSAKTACEYSRTRVERSF